MAFRQIERPVQAEQSGGFDLSALLPLLLSIGGSAVKGAKGGGVKFVKGSERGDLLSKFADLAAGGNGTQPLAKFNPSAGLLKLIQGKT